MEILNVGPLELLLIIIIMFILLGPQGMIRTAQQIGRWVRDLVRSPMWREIMGYSQEIRDLPNKILDETGLKETLEEVQQSTRAASDELNASLREAKEAARLPEIGATAITIDATATDNTIRPPTVPADLSATAGEAAASDAAAPVPAEGGSEVLAGSQDAAVVPAEAAASVEAEAAPRKQRGRKVKTAAAQFAEPIAAADNALPAAEAAIPSDNGSHPAPEVVPATPPMRKPRARKVKAAADAAASAVPEAAAAPAPEVQAEAAAPEAAAPKPRARKAKVAEGSAAAEPAAPVEPSTSAEPAAPVEPATRKPRARKPKVEADASAEPRD